MITLTNDSGRKFNVRIVLPGDKYGLNDCLTNDKGAMVEFYDDTHTGKAKTFERGQFVSRYYLATILKGSSNPTENGINLCGGVPEWVVSAANVRDAVAYAITKAKGE